MNSVQASESELLLWERCRRDPDDPGLVLSYGFSLPSSICVRRLNRALYRLVAAKFPNLQSRFEELDGKLMKRCVAPSEQVLEFAVADSCSGADPAWLKIDLRGGAQFRFVLARSSGASEHDAVLFLSFSHLAYDGSCYPELCLRLQQAFDEAADESAPVERVTSMSAYTPAPTTEANRAFWSSYFESHGLGQPLPFLRDSRAVTRDFNAEEIRFEGGELDALARGLALHGVSCFQFVLGCSALLVSKYGAYYEGESVVRIAHTASLRRKDDPLCCSMNLVSIAIDCADGTSNEFFTRLKQSRRRLREHQHVPTQQLVNWAGQAASKGAMPFNAVVNESTGLLPRTGLTLDGQKAALVHRPAAGGPFQLAFNFALHFDRFVLRIESPGACSSRGLLRELCEQWRCLALSLCEPNVAIEQIGLAHSLRPVASGREMTAPTSSLWESIQAVAEAAPGKVAICSGETQVTYLDLVRNVEALACEIESATVAESGPVGVHLQRSWRLPVAMLASMRLGRAFVPLDPTQPDDAIDHILRTAKVSTVVTDAPISANALGQRHPQLRNVLFTDELKAAHRGSIVRTPEPDRDCPAYVLFTSGSTGHPKGVVISRRNLANFMQSMSAYPGVRSSDRLLAVSAISFDISILELLLPLLCGATVEVADDATRQSAESLSRRIDESGATIVQATPSTWALLRTVGWRGRRPLRLLIGGEAMPSELAQYLLSAGHEVYNMYGPTETTIWASVAAVRDGLISLGTPVDNTRFYIVDDAFRSVPTGAAGQLVIEGDCVGDGYLNANTSAFFVGHEAYPTKRFYLTGDLARHSGDGRLEFLGRRDSQVKVRGHRVELEEINQRLRALAGDVDLLTVLRTSPEPHLHTFFVAGESTGVDPDAVLRALAGMLPAYKVPQALTRLMHWPLTRSGKTDVKFLASAPLAELPLAMRPLQPESEVGVASERAAITRLRAIIRDALHLEVDRSDVPLGWYGLNSLSYSVLAHRLGEEFGIAIQPQRLYALPTLSALADYLGRSADADDGVVPAAGAPRENTITATARSTRAARDPVAIIGMAALMPGNCEADEFWEGLKRGRNWVGPSDREGPHADSNGAFLRAVDGFDAKLFQVSPLESHLMDPRQRLLLQSAWHACEDAGYARATLQGKRVGCFVAASGADHLVSMVRSNVPEHPYTLSGSASSMLANRLSYFFDWRGPSSVIDAACAGSLSALVRACDALEVGSCEMALVAGVNLILDSHTTQALDAGNFLSRQNRCATFSDDADGYVRGEGVISFVLKPLAAAVRDGDAVHGVIRAAAENHGGRATSLTAPNPDAQLALLREVYDPELLRQVSFIETHGTGTRLGDPIEIDALQRLWASAPQRVSSQSVRLGALKTNIGHLEAAAGLASLVKVLLSLRHAWLPGNLHLAAVNRHIDLSGSPFEILDQGVPWSAQPRVAGISSFGFGGSNGHIVVEEYLAPQRVRARRTAYLIVLAARTASALDANRRALLDHVRSPAFEAESLGDLAYTLSVGREHLPVRAAWVVRDLDDMIEKLSSDATQGPVAVSSQSRGSFVNTLSAPDGEYETMLLRCADAYRAGATPVWETLYGDEFRRVHAPTYRFELQSCSLSRARVPAKDKRDHARAAVARVSYVITSPSMCIVRIPPGHEFFEDHKVRGVKVLPGVVHLEMCLRAAALIEPATDFRALDHFCWVNPILDRGAGAEVQLAFSADGGSWRVEVHCDGQRCSFGVLRSSSTVPIALANTQTIRNAIERGPVRVDAKELYARLAQLGLAYGPRFRCVQHVDVDGDFALAQLAANAGSEPTNANVLDGALQSGLAISTRAQRDGLMPFTLGAFVQHVHELDLRQGPYYALTKKKSEFRTDVYLCDDAMRPLASFYDLGVRSTNLRNSEELTHERI